MATSRQTLKRSNRDDLFQSPLALQLLLFALDDQFFGLHLEAVEQVVRAVEILRLPKAPEIVLGVVNIRGRIVPVVDIRRRFGLLTRTAVLSDHLIVARTLRRSVAVLVDAISGVVQTRSAGVVVSAEILPNLAYVEGVVTLDDRTVFIHDLDTLLSLEEERALDIATAGREAENEA